MCRRHARLSMAATFGRSCMLATLVIVVASYVCASAAVSRGPDGFKISEFGERIPLSEWAKLNGEIRETRTNLANCQEDCNRTREETARVKKEMVVHDLEILRLKGKLRGSADRLSSLRNERDGVRKQITEMEKQLEEAQVKLSTAHIPGWHYVSNYGWLWT